MRLYLDANAIIYSIESVTPFREAVLARISQAEAASDGMIVTSRLSRLECRVVPLRKAQTELLAIYELFFTRRSVLVVEISAAVIEKATELRSRYDLKTPDAIHIATAIESHADLFLTGDKRLARCPEIHVEVL